MKKGILILSLLLCVHISHAKSSNKSKIIFEKAILLLDQKKIEDAEPLFEQVVKFQKTNQKKAEVLFTIGQLFRLHFLFDDSRKYLNRSLILNDVKVNKTLYGDIRNELGLLYYDQHQYEKSLAEFSYCIKYCTKVKDDYGLEIVFNNIGNIFKETGDLITALAYYDKSLEYAKKLNIKSLKVISYTNIASIYYLQKNTKKALQFNKKALAIEINSSNFSNLANLQINIGLCYIDLKNYLKAKQYLLQSLSNYQKTANKEGVFMCYVNLYYTFYLLKNELKSEFYKSKALSGDYKNSSLKVKIDLYTYLKEEALAKKDTSNALSSSLKLLKLNEELIEEIKSEEINRLKQDINFTSISNELNETQLNLASETKEKQKMKMLNFHLKQQNQLNIILSLIGLSLFITIILILIKSNQIKRRTNEILEQQKKIVEEKNQEILNSLDFANSMEKLLLQQMNPHFLYNALTTIEASISIGDIQYAKNYLTLFADLLRKTLDNSRKDVISLEEEIDFLRAYIALNAEKQGDNFQCQFDYEQDEIEDFVLTPPMLVQPFIENALIHGLYHKTNGPKNLSIRIEPKQNYIIWTITDNGIGREKAKEIGKNHKGVSHGIKITVDRIFWMKKRYGNQFSIQYEDLEEGTRVILKTPILDDQLD